MLHAVLYLLFIIPTTKWLAFELDRKSVSMQKYWSWIAAAIAAALLGSSLSILYGPYLGNFFLHAIGGGVAGTFLYMYLAHTFKFRVNWRLQLVTLFMFVSTLGVLNELMEFILEAWGFGIMSLDSQDTWRDFVANTTGAFTVYALIKLVLHFKSGQKQG